MTPHVALEDGSVIGFKDGQAGVEQTALGDDDDVKARRDEEPEWEEGGRGGCGA